MRASPATEQQIDKHEDRVKSVVWWLCRSEVQEVGNRLMLNVCVGKVFSSQTGGVNSLEITGQDYSTREDATTGRFLFLRSL